MGKLPERHARCLRAVREALEPAAVPWAVTGSTARALHGTDVRPNDLDLHTTPGGAYALESALPGTVDERVTYRTTERIASHFGRLTLVGTTVELMGGVRTRLDNGGWSPPVRIRRHRGFVTFDGAPVPVMARDRTARGQTGGRK